MTLAENSVSPKSAFQVLVSKKRNLNWKAQTILTANMNEKIIQSRFKSRLFGLGS